LWLGWRGGDRVDYTAIREHEGLPPDASERFDRYLNESVVAETPASYRVRGRRSKRAPRR